MQNFIRRCITTIVGTDDKDIRRQQVSYNGSAVNAEIWAPYGMSYNLPPNCLSLYSSIGGDQGSLVVLPDRPQDRIKNLEESEVAFFNPITKTRSIYRKNGDLEIVVDGENGDRTVTIKKDDTKDVGGDLTVTIAGEANVTIIGDCNLTAANVNVDAATTNLGVGGPNIARLGDAVQVVVTSGSSTGTWNGTITSAGVNTSI